MLEADRAFKEAVRRMNAGNYKTACPLLERSHSLNPSSGTLLNLGDCQEHLGRTASAWRTFTEARALASATGRDDRAQVASARANRLVPTLCRLVIFPPPERRPISRSRSTRCSSLPRATVGQSRSIPENIASARPPQEGGEVVIAVQAPESGAIAQVQLPAAARGIAGATPMAEPEHSALDGQRVAALSCGAVGVVGLALGAAFGLQSSAKHSQSDDYCAGSTCSNPRGVELMDDARRAGNVSTVSFVVGGLGLGAGAVLWFARPFGEHEVVKANVGLTPTGIEMRGSW